MKKPCPPVTPARSSLAVLTVLFAVSAAVAGPHMGFRAANLTASERRAMGLDQEIGVKITYVDEASPAGKAGLCVGDVLLAFLDEKVASIRHLRELAGRCRPDDRVRIILFRRGELLDLRMVVGAKTSPEDGAKEPAEPPPEDEDIGPQLESILGKDSFQTLERLARDFGFEGPFTRGGLREFFSRMGFDEKALRKNLESMGVADEKIDQALNLLAAPKPRKGAENAVVGRWGGTFLRGKLVGTLDLVVESVDRLNNLKGRLTVRYGRVKLSSAVTGRISPDRMRVAFRTDGVGGYWTFDGARTPDGKWLEGKFSTVGSFGFLKGPEGTFSLRKLGREDGKQRE